jgi:hypothetical protein
MADENAPKVEQTTKTEDFQVKVGFRIPPRMPSVYAHHLLIQPGESEVIVSFFEIIPPLFINETLEERTERIKETGLVAECVARITVSIDKFPRFANAMMQVAEQLKGEKTAEQNDADDSKNKREN